jgi:dipeptidyl aminopeptidase/acylaminoacyl peptidase
MTTDRFRNLEPALPDLFHELAQMRTPDYLEAAIERATERSQRPRWTFPERWLPVELVTSRVPVARMPWRQIGVLALLAIVVIASLALYAGSQQRPLPAPFGPAANGSIVFAIDGDIYTADPRTGVSKAIVTGSERDSEPVFSLDGTRVLFGRPSDSDPGRLLFVSRDDGSALVQVTPEPLRGVSSWSFSPDGRSIMAFAAGDQGLAIVVIPSDGKGPAKVYPVFATTDDGPPQYRPDGSEIMFIGKEPGQANRGVYALDPATGTVRAIAAPASTRDMHAASWSPDGKHIALGAYDPSAVGTTARTHVVGVDGTGDITVDTNPQSVADFGFAWSNDGTRLIITRLYDANGSKARSAIVPIDRSSPGIEIECPPGVLTDDCTANWTWSPDDSLLLGTLDAAVGGKTQFLADPHTGQIRVAPWNASGHPAWQRLAR